MIKSSAAYQAAVTADVRRMLLRAIIDIIDPDIVYGAVPNSGEAAFSQSGQLHDKVMDLTPYATLERRRWVLDGTFRLIPEAGAAVGQMGFVGRALSGEDGTFSPAFYVEEQFEGVSILQACSVFFSASDYDGVAEDFTVEVKQGGTAYYTKTFTGNAERSVSLTGFTVYNPDAIRVTVTKWSKPGRRARISEILPGVYETWDGGTVASFSLRHQGNVACTALPYGTCTLTMDNLDRRFEPRSKDGVFQSIEDRQGIDISLGPRLPDGSVEYKRVGIFYQYSGGWKTGNNGLTMQWDLVDIVGLLADREFLPPDTLPTTLAGWIAALVAQLGVNFETHYTVDPDYADLPVTARSVSDVTGKKCGDILRWACMATGTWPRADAETGYLAVEPLWNQGSKIDLDNLMAYPTMKANDDIAALIFTLNDGSSTQYVISGNSTASSNTLTVSNPFIQTKDQALTAARQILSTYGGNQLELTGRGDPASEIGDVDTVWLDESRATTARRIMQDLSFQSGVLQGCQSTLLQADGSFLFQERVVLTEGTSWTAPANVKDNQLRLIISQGGSGGTPGTNGTFQSAGEDGIDGIGGKILSITVGINPQQTFTYSIGQGGGQGQEGGETTFGQYTSADGQRYEPNYTDIASGDAFARTGVKAPENGTGDGGARGQGGTKGEGHYETIYNSSGESIGSRFVVDVEPGPGQPGTHGASGFIAICWDKEDT